MAHESFSTTVNSAELGKDITLHITIRGMKTFRFRMWCVTWLLVLVSWISPVHIETEVE